jgi:hypothetical protein
MAKFAEIMEKLSPDSFRGINEYLLQFCRIMESAQHLTSVVITYYGSPLSTFILSGPGRSVGITTSYGLDGPWIEIRWKQDFPHLSREALGPTQPPVQWVLGLSRGVKSGRDVKLASHPLLVPLVMKE